MGQVLDGRSWIRVVAVALAIAAAFAGVGLYWWTRHTVPELDGEARVAGLKAPVEVQFDRYAIPHVYARDVEDVWTAAGYVQGRERLWQMEVYRRAASGRLSEIFGESTLPFDRRFLTLGLRAAAAVEWSKATPEVRVALEQYARGVNAAREAARGWRQPVEFRLSGVHPAPWSPVDSLSVAKLMAWRLSENRRGELLRGALARAFGAAEAARLMGELPPWAPTILGGGPPQNRTDVARSLSPAGPPTTDAARSSSSAGPPTTEGRNPPIAPDCSVAAAEPLPAALAWLAAQRPGASNSWVVSGGRTATGRPLLANDPHLAVEMPSIWYEMHLVAAGLDVAGATIPGSPFVVIGHNQKIAWGLTNVGADVQDLYIEQIDRERERYLYNGVWHPLSASRHEIRVHGRTEPVIFTSVATRHGALADETEWQEPPFAVGPPVERAPTGRMLALRWDALARGETAGAFEALGRAASWEEFLAAVRRFSSPAQNFVYADVDGNIGYAMSGLLPIRGGGDGSVPVPGWSGEYEWRGFVDPATLPHELNPPSGQIVTANNEVDRRFAHLITRDWLAPFRARRILEMLGDRRELDVAAFAKMQADLTSRAADLLLQPTEAAAARARSRKVDAAAVSALDRLRLWDRRVDGRPVVALYEAFERALWRRVFADEMDPDLFRQFDEHASNERFAGPYAIVDDPSARWFDDVATIDRRETREDIFAIAAADALTSLRRQFGPEAEWGWDRLHAVRFAHALGPAGWPIAWFFNRGPVPLAGDGMTVNKTGFSRRRPYGAVEVPTYRQILDVGAWDNSVAVNTTGQSGHAMSQHYFDQNSLWRDGRYHPLPYSRNAVAQARVSRLLLVP